MEVRTNPIIIPEFPELTFEDAGHVYKLNNAIVPSVTTVMKPLSDDYYQSIDLDIMRLAADRGKEVHAAVESYIKFGIEDISSGYAGYLNAFKKWNEDIKPVIVATETKIYHKYLRYAGTSDLVCIINSRIVCVDLKTSATINTVLTGVQLEAYAKAYESHGILCDEKAIVHLKADGTYRMMMYEKNDRESWETFGALMVIYNHLQKYRR